MRIYLLASRGHLTPAAQLESVVPWLAGRVTTIAYDTLFRGMTPAYWWRQAKESYWDVERHVWSSRREALHAAASLGVRLLRYLGAPRRPKPGTYIFADLELLSPGELQKAAVVWQALAGAGSGVRLLNHPARSMRRYELLRTLYERGINSFDVSRLTEARWPPGTRLSFAARTTTPGPSRLCSERGTSWRRPWAPVTGRTKSAMGS